MKNSKSPCRVLAGEYDCDAKKPIKTATEGEFWEYDNILLVTVKLSRGWRVFEPKTGLPVCNECETKKDVEALAIERINANGGREKVESIIKKTVAEQEAKGYL